MIMNMLTYDEPTKDPIFPDLGELVALLNEVMPTPLMSSPRAINASVDEDYSGVLRSNVEKGSADLDQSRLAWTDIGKIIRMLQDLLNNGQDFTLGEYSIKHVTYIRCHHILC